MKDRYINKHTLAKHTQRKHREIERQKKGQKEREKKDKNPSRHLKKESHSTPVGWPDLTVALGCKGPAILTLHRPGIEMKLDTEHGVCVKKKGYHRKY